MEPAIWRQLRAAVHADPALQARLAAIADADEFAISLAAEAAQRGISLPADFPAMLPRPDPLGLARFTPRPPDGSAWPGPAWLPAHAGALGPQACVDWLYAGETRFTAPFFEHTIRRLQLQPFNSLFPYRMTLADFIDGAEHAQAPDGFIFHMSRCGSTLVAQMLAALPESVIVSEPPALDEVLQLALRDGENTAVAALRAIVSAFGRRAGRPFVLKLDAWHALALPLFRRAFPHTPWVFLYRDPVEVLVSHMRVRGGQMVPAIVSPSLYGLATELPDEDYCGRVLEAICRAAADHIALGGGLLVNYTQLPAALEETILPHFKTEIADGERRLMRAATQRDAKAPYQNFVSDSEDKRREASPTLRAVAERHLAPIYARLEAMRLSAVATVAG